MDIDFLTSILFFNLLVGMILQYRASLGKNRTIVAHDPDNIFKLQEIFTRKFVVGPMLKLHKCFSGNCKLSGVLLKIFRRKAPAAMSSY